MAHAVWNDRDHWSALCSGATCPICVRGVPLDVLAALEATWVTMQEAAAMALMRDARRVSAVLAAVTGAVKLNYEIHGNSPPHLHLHFFPRYRGDQFEGQPINPKVVVQPVYEPGEFGRLREALALALGPAAEEKEQDQPENSHEMPEQGGGA